MTDAIQKMWDIAARMRLEGTRPDLLAIVQKAKAEGVDTGLDQIRASIPAFGLTIVPDYVPEFIAEYLKGSKLQAILDPWAGVGAMLVPLVRKLEPAIAVGINQMREEHELACLINDNLPIDWQLGDPLRLLDTSKQFFDVVASVPSLGWHQDAVVFPSASGPITLNDGRGNLIMLKAAMKLAPDGVGFFVVNPGRKNDTRRVYSNLERFGLFIDAELTISGGAFGPAVSSMITGSLLNITPRKTRATLRRRIERRFHFQRYSAQESQVAQRRQSPTTRCFAKPFRLQFFRYPGG